MKGTRILRFFAHTPTPSIEFFSKPPISFRIENAVRQNSMQWKNAQPIKLRAAITDLSGTTIDEHVLAPTTAVMENFERYGVPITPEEAREPMGLRKDLHIAAILNMTSVQARWLEIKGKLPTKADEQALFKQFVPIQLSVLKEYSNLIPGVREGAEKLRKMGIKIACTTGFTEEMVNVIAPFLRSNEGFSFDAVVAGDNVQHGARPEPHMLFKCMDILGVHLPGEVMKVGDTLKDIGEGLSAGVWTVALWEHSNFTGIRDKEHLKNLSSSELKILQEKARKELTYNSGAHYVAPNFSALIDIAQDINKRLIKGETPTDHSIDYNERRAFLGN